MSAAINCTSIVSPYLVLRILLPTPTMLLNGPLSASRGWLDGTTQLSALPGEARKAWEFGALYLLDLLQPAPSTLCLLFFARSLRYFLQYNTCQPFWLQSVADDNLIYFASNSTYSSHQEMLYTTVNTAILSPRLSIYNM